MGRRYSLSLSLLVLGLLSASVASAGVPDPSLSTVPNVVGAPGGGLLYSITVVGTSGPIDSANVTLRWSTPGDTSTCWCPTQTHPTVTATTNASGIATFNLKLGGCLNPATIPGGVAVEVFANNVKLKEVGQVSPDVVSSHSPPCSVSLTDAVAFTGPLASGTYSFCYDLNSDMAVGLIDAVTLTPFAAGAANCQP
jgi:hypothetical protein